MLARTAPKNAHDPYLYQSPRISAGIAYLYVQIDFLHNIVHMIIKYCTPLFGRKYQMVYQYRYVMTLMYVFAHIGILRRKRRGIQPQGIQFCAMDLLKSPFHSPSTDRNYDFW